MSVRFAIIGCGRIAYRHIEAIQANPDAKLVALCDLDLGKAQERGQGTEAKLYQNYHEMLQSESIDVVNIMTPSGMHAEHTIEIIELYGKHVVVEKPMVLRVSDGVRLVEAARQRGVQLFVVHQNRFNRAIQKIRSGIEENLFGKIVLGTVRIRWSRGQAYYDRDPWRGTWALDGGALTNQAIHHIDLLRWLLGDVESVSAVGKTQLVDVEVEDTAVAWVRFRSGALGAVEATTATRPVNVDLEASLSVLSERGTAIIEGASVNKLTTWTFDETVDFAEHSEEPPNVYGFGHNVIIDNVVETIRGAQEPLVTGDDALASIRLLNALYCSIEQAGREMRLDQEPISERLGVIAGESEQIAQLYRTPREGMGR